MQKQQELLSLVVGLLGIVAAIIGVFGFGGMSGFWRLIHVAGGVVMAWSVWPILRQFFRSLTKK